MEQLKAFGIQADLKIVEDPDATYMTGDAYEIGFYRNLTDKSGDPFSFIDAAFRTGTYQDIAGFENPETDALIEELRYEGDPDRRAELANEIMQQVYDSNTIIFLNCYNRNTVVRNEVKNFEGDSPFEFYGLNANTTVESIAKE